VTGLQSQHRVLRRVRALAVLVPPTSLLLAGVCLVWFHLTEGPPTQRVHVRWAATVTATERDHVEREVGLIDGTRFEERTWQYFLRDRSSANIHRLITDPRVEDTFHINRATSRVQLDRPDLSPTFRRWLESDRLGQLGFVILLLTIGMIWWFWQDIARAMREGPGVIGTVFVANTLIFTIGFRALLETSGGVDIDSHLRFARDLDLRHLTAPHFLFQVLVRVLVAVGVSYTDAAVVILGLCYGVMAVLIAREIDSRSLLTWRRALLLIPAMLLASHIFLFTVASHDVYLGYLVPIAYHNPTQQLNKVFATWIMFLSLPTFVAGRAITWRTGMAIGVLCVLSAIAKPSFLIAFLPAVALWEARDLVRLHWMRLFRLAATVGVPSIIVLLWQARIAYGSNAEASIVIAPFAVVNPWQIPVKFSMSLAFPIVVALAAVRTHTWNARIAFIWVFMVVAITISLLLAEGGGRASDGNFMWTAQTATFLAYVESLLFLVSTPLSSWWKRVSWAVFATHVVCGGLWYGLLFTSRWHYFTRI
jgi:hypothetical protein